MVQEYLHWDTPGGGESQTELQVTRPYKLCFCDSWCLQRVGPTYSGFRFLIHSLHLNFPTKMCFSTRSITVTSTWRGRSARLRCSAEHARLEPVYLYSGVFTSLCNHYMTCRTCSSSGNVHVGSWTISCLFGNELPAVIWNCGQNRVWVGFWLCNL